MSKLPVRNMEGKQTGEFELPDALLVRGRGRQLVHDAVVAYRAHQRAGTASTLGKGAVAGSNKKPWKQKGTGMARAGYRQSPIWRGGAVAFGPKPGKYTKKLTKGAARLAFRRAFSDKVAAGRVVVLDEVTIPEAKTRYVATLLKNLEATRGALFILDQVERNIGLASRNMHNVEVAASRNVNTYQVVRCPVVFVTKKGMEALEQRLRPAARRAS